MQSAKTPRSEGSCRFHGTARGCRYGSACKFRHEEPIITSRNENNWVRPSSRSQQQEHTTHFITSADKSLFAWKRQLTLASSSQQLNLSKLNGLLQDGQTLVNGESSSRHEVLRTLASEDGLAIIDKLIGYAHRKDASGVMLSNRQHFEGWLCPLAKCLTHPDVLSSFVLERFRNDIYVFMYGLSGRRLLKFLPTVAENLKQAIKRHGSSLDGPFIVERSILTSFESPLALLFQIIELNGNAHIHPDIPPLIQELAEGFEIVLTLEALPHGCQTMRHLSRVQDRLGIGQSIPSFLPFENLTTQLPSFQVKQDLPGSLSTNGPRHDNDRHNIAEIQILPTLEEIRSERLEYLPFADPTTWHVPGIRGLIDRQFRLLREDTVGQLRDAIHAELETMEQPHRLQDNTLSNRHLLRTNAYHALRVHSTFIDRHHGFCLAVSFQQPQNLRGKGTIHRREWWERTKRLQSDALVCIIGSDNHLLFCSVFGMKDIPMVVEGEETSQAEEKLDLFTREDRAFTTLRLCNMTRPDIETALRAINGLRRISLVEFPGVLLPAFAPTLEALQKMLQTQDMPFSEILLQNNTAAAIGHRIPQPTYATKPGFTFSLKCVMNTDTDLDFEPGSAFDISDLARNSVFDHTQSQAIIDALNRSFAVIQGPPGTGKSFIGIAIIRILLEARERGDLGPILCVCYTNHALDQLLEHLVDHRVRQMIRIGSRSKSERLAELNLVEITKKMSQTKVESSELYHLRVGLKEKETEINRLLDIHASNENWKSLPEYLEVTHPYVYETLLSEQDEDGFTRVVNHPRQRLTDWIRCGFDDSLQTDSVSIEELEEQPMDRLTRRDRQALYDHWMNESQRYNRQTLVRQMDAYNTDRIIYNDIRQEVRLRCLQDANLIGITTSGLARNLELLRRVHSKIMICEEAGEVLEAHMLTALLPSVEHAVLIGDHQQLRPQISRFNLSCEHPQGAQYSLDVSLYERLVQPQTTGISPLPYSTLAIQRRMHPSISRLLRNTLYPLLQDGPSVNDHPPVVGMRNRLAWLNHCQWEDKAEQRDVSSTSHSNTYEVEMATALASHLIRQGTYKPNDIAVLTPYLGQLHLLRKILGVMYEIVLTDHDVEALENAGLVTGTGLIAPENKPPQISKSTALRALKVATIDNFQGEEAKIVIISLVRSNQQNNCGFLRTSNRINVLLSRAQHGMYIIGNVQTAQSTPMWQNIIKMLREDNLVQSDLDLQCPRYAEVPLKVRWPGDFQQLSPEGGCYQKCADRLDCGHACINKCHSKALHSAVKCLEPCPRSRKTCQHLCPRKCGDPCIEQCTVNLHDPNRTLPCGHLQADLPCWQSQDLSTYACLQEVSRTIPGCGHECTLPCFTDFASDDFQCTAICGAVLTCGHACKRPCFQCTVRSNGAIQSEGHQTCTYVCERPYTTCRHYCVQICHGTEPCPLCDSPCDVACSHSKCNKKCNEPCTPCAEEHCASQCPHNRCSMPCAAPCDWIPCSKRCRKILDCGHQCPTLCGETCPPPACCQICCNETVKAQVVDYLEMKSYGEIDLDDDPCIFPACGHALTVSSMDGHMDMRKHYKYDSEDSISAVNDAAPFSNLGLKTCPSCRGSLRNMARYGRIVRRTLLDESTKKFMLWSNRNVITFTERFRDIQGKLLNSYEQVKVDLNSAIHLRLSASQKRRSLPQAAKALLISGRYREMFMFRDEVETFTKNVSEQEQPYSRVWDLCENARRRRRLDTNFTVEDGALQTRCREDAVILSLRCDLAILSDLITLVRDKVPKMRIKTFELDLSGIRDESHQLLVDATRSQRPGNRVESHLFTARCASLERTNADEATAKILLEEATLHLDTARQICTEYPGSTLGMMEEVDTIEEGIRGALYTIVTSEERMAVLRAMRTEFLGTGHWYYCRNGHPFTVGECGGPMQQTSCPECGEPVGGVHHHAAEGVRRADDLDAELGNLAL